MAYTSSPILRQFEGWTSPASPADVTLAVAGRGAVVSRFTRGLPADDTRFDCHRSGSSGDGIGRCRRMRAGRIDCSLVPEFRCAAVVSVRLGSDGRLRWGTYRCPIAERRRLVKPVRRLLAGRTSP